MEKISVVLFFLNGPAEHREMQHICLELFGVFGFRNIKTIRHL